MSLTNQQNPHGLCTTNTPHAPTTEQADSCLLGRSRAGVPVSGRKEDFHVLPVIGITLKIFHFIHFFCADLNRFHEFLTFMMLSNFDLHKFHSNIQGYMKSWNCTHEHMKLSIALSALALTGADSVFESWKTQHGKTYTTDSEYNKRCGIFFTLKTAFLLPWTGKPLLWLVL